MLVEVEVEPHLILVEVLTELAMVDQADLVVVQMEMLVEQPLIPAHQIVAAEVVDLVFIIQHFMVEVPEVKVL
jgi:hypothetical protein